MPASSLQERIDTRLGAWRMRLGSRPHPTLDRQCRLAVLVGSVEVEGHRSEAVAACLRDPLAAYEADLLQALAAPEPP